MTSGCSKEVVCWFTPHALCLGSKMSKLFHCCWISAKIHSLYQLPSLHAVNHHMRFHALKLYPAQSDSIQKFMAQRIRMIQETAYSHPRKRFFPGQDWKKTELGEHLSGLLTYFIIINYMQSKVRINSNIQLQLKPKLRMTGPFLSCSKRLSTSPTDS